MCELWPNLLRWGRRDFLLCYGKLLAVIKGSGCGYVGFGMRSSLSRHLGSQCVGRYLMPTVGYPVLF